MSDYQFTGGIDSRLFARSGTQKIRVIEGERSTTAVSCAIRKHQLKHTEGARRLKRLDRRSSTIRLAALFAACVAFPVMPCNPMIMQQVVVMAMTAGKPDFTGQKQGHV